MRKENTFQKYAKKYLAFALGIAVAVSVLPVNTTMVRAMGAQQAEQSAQDKRLTVQKKEVQAQSDVKETETGLTPKGEFSLNQAETIFLTDTGKTYYQKLTVAKAQRYLVHASSLAARVSIVIANEKKEVVEILDQNTAVSRNGVTAYSTASLVDFSEGTWYIGVSAQCVSKITLKVSEPVAVTEGETASQSVAAADSMIAYTFVPKEEGVYQFFQSGSKGDLEIKLYDETGKLLKTCSDYRWLRDWKVTFAQFQRSLKKDTKYYLTVTGKYTDASAQNYLNISKRLVKDCSVLPYDGEVKGNIEDYNKYIFYQIKPRKAGTYFLNAVSAEGHLDYSVYDEKEQLVKKASIAKYEYDSYGNSVYKKQLSISMSQGKTYYVALRMANFKKGTYSLSCKKLEEVKKVTMLHKPVMKRFIKGVDSYADLRGTVLAIHYKSGKSAKWVYGESNAYKEGFQITKRTVKQGENKVVTFTYRNKSVSYKIPVCKVNEAYAKAEQLQRDEVQEGTLSKGKYRFYRFIPKESGLYGFEGISGEYFRMVVFGEKGGKKAIASSHFVRDSRGKLRYQRCRVAQPLVKGKTYYIGAYYPWSEKESTVQIKAYLDNPAAPSGLVLKRLSDNEVKLSWKAVKKAYGYQIVYYPAANPAKKKRLTTVYAAGNYVDGLKKGTTYYFKVRAYRQVGNKKCFGAFSETKVFRY